MNITTVGIDLAKDIITVYAQDAQGHCVLSRNLKFKELAEWLVQLPEGCLIGMEACSTAVSIPPSRRLDADCLPLVYHPPWRCLPAQPTGTRRALHATSRAEESPGQTEPGAAMGHPSVWAGGLPQDPGCHRQQTRPATMGLAGEGRNLRPECLAEICHRRDVLSWRV